MSPDLFYRWGFKGPIDFADPAGRERIMGALKNLTDDKVKSDVEATLRIADGDKAARKGKIGVYGFCMGGKFTLVMSQVLGDRVAAGASIHPGGLVTDEPNSPHRHLDKVRGDIYFGIADNDQSATPEQMQELEKALKAANIHYHLEWHPGALHGYMMSSRKELYNEAAAEKVWGRMKDLFGSTL
jgi:carboxymethylenebutenolidase